MNPLVIQLIAALIAQGPQMIGAVAALIKAAHGQPLDVAEHQALGKALAGAMAPGAAITQAQGPAAPLLATPPPL